MNRTRYRKKRKNKKNISSDRLIFIKPFRWFDTHKDFLTKELTRQIIPDRFLRKPHGPPNKWWFRPLLTQLVNNNWKIDNWISLFNEHLMSENTGLWLVPTWENWDLDLDSGLSIYLQIFLNVYSMHDKLLHWEALISALVSNIGNTLRRNFNIFHKRILIKYLTS